jgi:cell division protein ZipA
MPELRWALLALGVVFLVSLAVWELRKQRGRRETGPVTRPDAPSARQTAGADDPGGAGDDRRVDPAPGGAPGVGHGHGARAEPAIDFTGISVDREPLPAVPVIEIDDPSGASESPVRGRERRSEASPPATSSNPVERAAAWLAGQPESQQPSRVVLDWPPEDRRHIVSLRLLPRQGEMLTGAALRQALTGEGFQHGEFDIFHKPLPDGRAIVSAAGLTRPGTFALDRMDAQLFPGVSLFCVLPGPLPGRDCVERLVQVGRTLSQRLRAELHDARGQPLTEARLAELRRQVAASAADDLRSEPPSHAAASG